MIFLEFGLESDGFRYLKCASVIFTLNQFTCDYVKLYIGYFSNRLPVWERIFTLENLIVFNVLRSMNND